MRGYIPNGNILDSLLVGYYGASSFTAAGVRAGIPSDFECCHLIWKRC